MDKALVVAKIEAATKELNDAAAHLERVIGEILRAPRAEKIGISAVVEEAFSKLNMARAALEELEEFVPRDPP